MKPRGFAAIPPAVAKEYQSKGGKNSPMKFQKGDERARTAGRKGGAKSKRGKK